MSERTFADVAAAPVAGDIVEIREDGKIIDTMLRVLAVADGHVGYKQYGAGRHWTIIRDWTDRLGKASAGRVIRIGNGKVVPE